jgi:hypothetical protein
MYDQPTDSNPPQSPVFPAEGRERLLRLWQEIIEVVQLRYNVTQAEAERQVGGWLKQLDRHLGKTEASGTGDA